MLLCGSQAGFSAVEGWRVCWLGFPSGTESTENRYIIYKGIYWVDLQDRGRSVHTGRLCSAEAEDPAAAQPEKLEATESRTQHWPKVEGPGTPRRVAGVSLHWQLKRLVPN